MFILLSTTIDIPLIMLIVASIHPCIHPSIHISYLLDLSICPSIGQSAAFRHQYVWSYWLYLEADEYYGWVTSVLYAPLHSILHLQHANINDTTGESIRLDVVTSSRDELNEVRSIVRALSEGNKVMRSLTLHLLYYTIFDNYHHLYLSLSSSSTPSLSSSSS